MTKRQRYLKALRNQKVDSLVWAPNFDYWLHYHSSNKSVPAKYKGMSRDDIVRAVGGSIWNRAAGLRIVYDQKVRETSTTFNGSIIHEFCTPIGTIREVHRPTESEHSSMFLAEHFVKDIESVKILKYVIQACHYEPDYAPTQKAIDETGDDGVVLNSYFCVPFIQFCKMDAGYINGFYLWNDHRTEVDSLLDVYMKNYLQGYSVLADGPADVIATGDNMDGTMISGPIFKEYAIPFYQEARKIISPKNKLFEGHWCGRTQNLLPLVPGCGLDIVEAIVSKPMADIELSEAIDMLKGEVVLQGGIPSVLVCEQGCTRDEFVKYIQETIVPFKGRRGFILGMSDNVPPNADFWRVEQVAKLIA
jgi:hypothetical protein